MRAVLAWVERNTTVSQVGTIAMLRATFMLCWGLSWLVVSQGTLANEGSNILEGVRHAEITYGLNQSNLSLLRGVVIDTKLEPTMDFKLETDRAFVSLQNGLGLWLNHTPPFKSGVSINYMLGRHQSTDLHYQRLGDQSGSFDLYAFAEWQPILEAVTFYGNVAQTPSPVARQFAQAGVTLGLALVKPWNAFFDFNETWGNAVYWQSYYGVNSQQHVTSMKGFFMPTQGGALYQSQSFGAVYSLNNAMDLIMGVGTLQASNALMQSPVMGSRSQHTVMVMLSHKLLDH